MDVIAKARELGAVIQQDERYLNFMKAKRTNEADDALNALISKLNLIQASYQAEDAKDKPDESVKEGYDREFRAVYAQVMQNENMIAYQQAKQEIDNMMQYLMQLLSLCVNGEDPETCEVPEQQGCGGNCASCGGCG